MKTKNQNKRQKTKGLMMWHDCSTIGGHSYLLMMAACIYETQHATLLILSFTKNTMNLSAFKLLLKLR